MIRDPQGDHFMYMGFGAMAAAGLLGAAVGTYATVAMLLRLLASGVVTMLDAVRDPLTVRKSIIRLLQEGEEGGSGVTILRTHSGRLRACLALFHYKEASQPLRRRGSQR